MKTVTDLQRVEFSYGAVPRLPAVDLAVSEGELLSIVGPEAAGHCVHSLGRMMVIAATLGAVLSISGLALSYGPDLPAGPTIILLTGAANVVSATVKQVFDRRRARLAAARGLSRGALCE